MRSHPLVALVALAALAASGCLDPSSSSHGTSKVTRPRQPVGKQTCNAEVRETTHASPQALDHLVSPGAGYALDGSGIVVGDWDDGHALERHVDLTGSVVVRDAAGPSEHATHTTATVIGAGRGDPRTRGFAPQATVLAYDWLFDVAEVAQAAPVLHLSSHPYGLSLGWDAQAACPALPTYWGGSSREDPAFGKYTARAAELDSLIARTGLAMFFPAGNQRLDAGVAAGAEHLHVGSCSELHTDMHLQERTLQYDTLGGQGVAKNVITVGAVHDAPGDVSGVRLRPLDISGFGPTDDGRIKPEIGLGGESVRSASVRSEQAYSRFEGTSSATAAAAGAAALLAQLHRRERGAGLAAPSLRALLVHGARDAGSAPGPDYRIGYGVVDLAASLEVLAAGTVSSAAGEGDTLVHGAVVEQTLSLGSAREVAAGTALRVTLAWTDPPAPANTAGLDDDARTLVNDLDLALIAPDGTRFLPWTLDPDEPTAAARSDRRNRRDNLEVVDVAAAENRADGRWSVEVAARGSLFRDRPQAFALVSSFPLAAPPEPVLLAPRQVTVSYRDGETPPPVEVVVQNGGEAPLEFSARSLSQGIAVSPDSGTGGDALTIRVDPARFPATAAGPTDHLAAIELVSDDPRGVHTIGVLVRVQCEPDCEDRACGVDPRCGTLCGSCPPGAACAQGACQPWADACPVADLGSAVGEGVARGQLGGAGSGHAGSCGGGQSGELAFAFSAPHAGRFVFTTRGSQGDTVLYLRDGGCDGEELACNDDSVGTSSATSATLEEGQRVVAFVDGFDAAAGGDFQLNVRALPCIEADLGSAVGPAVARGATIGAIDDASAACGGAGSEDAAFAWTAPRDGVYSFSLFDPRFAGVLYLMDGCGGSVLGCSPAPDVGPLELSLAAGDRLVVAIDGRDGSGGEFELDVYALGDDDSCDGLCGGPARSGRCSCDPECVQAGDCCVDACERCGHCRCLRDCAGRECGDDGCGGRCGDCGGGQACRDGRCVPDPCDGVQCEPCEICVDGACEALPEGAPCEDGDACTVLDRCEQGRCGGQPRDCDDGIACTRDRCLSQSGACRSTETADCARCDGGVDCPLQLSDAGARPDAARSPDATTAVSRDSGGCGCRVARAPARGPRWPLALVLAVWVARAGSRARRAGRRRSSVGRSPR